MTAKFAALLGIAAAAALFGSPAEARPRGGPQVACTMEYRPVCGTVRGRRRTFSNSCVARSEGARAIRRGACGRHR